MDDVIDGFSRRSIGSRVPFGLLAFLDFVLAGTLWRYLLSNWRSAFFLYPFVMFGLLIAAAFLIGVLHSKSSDQFPLLLPTSHGLSLGPWPRRSANIPLSRPQEPSRQIPGCGPGPASDQMI